MERRQFIAGGGIAATGAAAIAAAGFPARMDMWAIGMTGLLPFVRIEASDQVIISVAYLC